ncbi:replication initiator protein A [Burkholderia ubonensis]|uniref:replication initiator protein A n=1 Tax=Burkholderia ubonensis TaxID=101571 RepID=UPI000A4546C2|nr:replication initiator protein A [Burkholderia ubonensis]
MNSLVEQNLPPIAEGVEDARLDMSSSSYFVPSTACRPKEPTHDEQGISPAHIDVFEVLVVAHDWSVKGDLSSMEYPIFSLSKNKDTRIRVYSRGGKTVKVIPSALGAATLFDKDILLYCISQIVKAHGAGIKVSPRLKIAVHPFLIGTRRSTGGASYMRVLDTCRRLKGTTIETNVKTNEREQVEGFGLIEDYKVVQYTKNGKGALELELTIANWLYRAALASDILTLHPDYFSLGQALERRLYELGRKHCGYQPWFSIGLPLLKEKAGSSQSASHFRQELKDIIKLNRLPDYRLALDESTKPNQLVYLTRDSKRLVTEANRAGKLSWLSDLLQQPMLLSKPVTR